MASAREAMKTGDTGGFTYAVHTLRGMFRSLSAPLAQEAAGVLEGLSFKNNRERAEATYAVLEQEVQALMAQLPCMTDRTALSSHSFSTVRGSPPQKTPPTSRVP